MPWHRTRRWAGCGLVALGGVVLPVNVQMQLDARAAGASTAWLALLWLRLPLVAWIWRASVGHAPELSCTARCGPADTRGH